MHKEYPREGREGMTRAIFLVFSIRKRGER
jgi:hypothetical protein